jgi:hypothetical protein
MKLFRKFIYLITICITCLFCNIASAQITAQMAAIEKSETIEKNNEDHKNKKEELITIDNRFVINMVINLITVAVIIGYIYNRNYHKTEILFTFFAFNIVIFLLTYVMNHVKISLGAAFGLFAIFSMLRYRTEGISPKDMTYLFIVIAIGMICAIRLNMVTLSIICGVLILVTAALDGNILVKRQFSKEIIYDNISLIRPEQQIQLIEDLKSRTGLNIYKIRIGAVDFLRDSANIEIFYHD